MCPFKKIIRDKNGRYQGGLAATFNLADFLVFMIAPIKKSVNHLTTVARMRITRT